MIVARRLVCVGFLIYSQILGANECVSVEEAFRLASQNPISTADANIILRGWLFHHKSALEYLEQSGIWTRERSQLYQSLLFPFSEPNGLPYNNIFDGMTKRALALQSQKGGSANIQPRLVRAFLNAQGLLGHQGFDLPTAMDVRLDRNDTITKDHIVDLVSQDLWMLGEPIRGGPTLLYLHDFNHWASFISNPEYWRSFKKGCLGIKARGVKLESSYLNPMEFRFHVVLEQLTIVKPHRANEVLDLFKNKLGLSFDVNKISTVTSLENQLKSASETSLLKMALDLNAQLPPLLDYLGGVPVDRWINLAEFDDRPVGGGTAYSLLETKKDLTFALGSKNYSRARTQLARIAAYCIEASKHSVGAIVDSALVPEVDRSQAFYRLFGETEFLQSGENTRALSDRTFVRNLFETEGSNKEAELRRKERQNVDDFFTQKFTKIYGPKRSGKVNTTFEIFHANQFLPAEKLFETYVRSLNVYQLRLYIRSAAEKYKGPPLPGWEAREHFTDRDIEIYVFHAIAGGELSECPIVHLGTIPSPSENFPQEVMQIVRQHDLKKLEEQFDETD